MRGHWHRQTENPWRANSTPCSEPLDDQLPCEKLWGVMLLGEVNREARLRRSFALLLWCVSSYRKALLGSFHLFRATKLPFFLGLK
jgi:hypothetical protein